MKTIEKTIDIDAPKEKVWAVLVEDMYNKDWFALFSEGTRAETDWIEGHKVSFKDKAGNGMTGRILEKKPYEKLVYEFDGVVNSGEEDTSSEMAHVIKGTKEIYELSENGGMTRLHITADIHEDYYDQLFHAWEAALQRIAELSHAV